MNTQDSNPDVCDAAAVLNQLNYQANRALVVMWVDYKPEDDEYRFRYEMFIHESHVFFKTSSLLHSSVKNCEYHTLQTLFQAAV